MPSQLPEQAASPAEFSFDVSAIVGDWSPGGGELITHRAISQSVNQYDGCCFSPGDEDYEAHVCLPGS